MKTIELFSDEIFDAVNIGAILSDFNEDNGDYIKVELFDETSDLSKYNFYSNRLLLKYPEDGDSFYFGDYHYHTEMGFMEGSYRMGDDSGEEFDERICSYFKL